MTLHRGGRLIALILFVLMVETTTVAAPRPFPDTRAKIRVFNDQLPSSMTAAQWRFAARHYAGCQKMTRSWTRRMRRLNPGFLVLHYQLAVGAGPAPYVVGDRWTNDLPSVTHHEDWFLHDSEGHRLSSARVRPHPTGSALPRCSPRPQALRFD